MMTLFNELNSRKLHGQRNVFGGLQRNAIFCFIWILTMVVQVRAWMNRCMDGWIDDGWKKKWVHRWMSRRMDKHEEIYKLIDRWILERLENK